MGDANTSSQWQFTWETLAHIPTLRLYIFNPEIVDITAVCRYIAATLKLRESLLVISWPYEKNGSCETSVLMIPIPKVLIDPGCHVDVKVMGDYIEAKLILLLPLEHPVVAEIWGAPGSGVDQHLPPSLDSDMEKFSSEGVNFFCKHCSTKLTRQTLRNFVEIPSTNWQEVADNWFGACCSFGGVSEKLVSNYMNTFDCKVGTCLLDRASVTVCEHDLEGTVWERTSSDLGMESPKPNEYHEKIDSKSLSGRISRCESSFCSTEVSCAAIANGRSESDASTSAYNAQQYAKVYGNGFMITPFNLSKGLECVEFSCNHCSSPLGSYPRAQGTAFPIDGGVRLFKCYISSSLSVGARDDIFKKYTLQNIFTNLLIEGAQVEISFRLMVCDLRTRSPVLQIVLLNSRAWCCSGFCSENMTSRGFPTIHMQPVAKVLFSDYTASTEVNLIATNERPTLTGSTEEVYMMARQIEELRRSLKSSMDKLPHSCSSLQGMSLSFLER